jgi:hypothetical protein
VTQHTENSDPGRSGAVGWPKSQSERGRARSTIRPMTSVSTPQETRRLDPRQRERATGHLLVATSIVQFTLGLALLLTPASVARLLAGIDPTWPELAVVLRVAGLVALTIGAWCVLGRLSETGFPRSRPLDLLPGLVVYNGCAVAVIADAIIRGIHAPLLWPAWALHSALLVWSVACLAIEREGRS